jgi:hypothetical protein
MRILGGSTVASSKQCVMRISCRARLKLFRVVALVLLVAIAELPLLRRLTRVMSGIAEGKEAAAGAEKETSLRQEEETEKDDKKNIFLIPLFLCCFLIWSRRLLHRRLSSNTDPNFSSECA